MVLENFINWSALGACKSFANVDINSTRQGGGINSLTANSSYYTNNAQGRYVDIGFGNTPETSADYKLADSNAVDSPTLTWVASLEARAYPSLRVVSSTYRNDTGSDVIVKEVGIVTHGAGTSDNGYNALLTRTVLDTPIIVASGETKTFTISLDV